MLDRSPESIKAHLDFVLEKGIDFEISDVIKDGFSRFKKSASKYILYVLVLAVFYLVGSAIPLGQAILGVCIVPAMVIGSMYFCFNDEKNERGDFGDFFKGFNDFKRFLPANFIIFALSTIVSLILIPDIQKLQEVLLASEGGIEDFQVAFDSLPRVKIFIVLGGMLLIQFFTFYVNYFIGIYQLDTVESLKYRALFALRKAGILLVFHLVMLCLIFFSVFLFIIGLLIAAGILVPIYYSSFLELTNYNQLVKENHEIEEIG